MKSRSALLSASLLLMVCFVIPPARAWFNYTGTVLHSPYSGMDNFPQAMAAYKTWLLGSDLGSFNNGSCSLLPGRQAAAGPAVVERNAVVYSFALEGSGQFTRQVLLNSSEPVLGLALGINNASAIVGSPGQNQAYQYLFTSRGFQPVEKIIPVPDTYSCFGSAIAMNRHWLAIAAPDTWRDKFGKVYIYRWVQGRWRFTQILEPTKKEHAIHFGQRLVMNDYLLAVTGSPYQDRHGRFQDIYVYQPVKDKWLAMGEPVSQLVFGEGPSAIALVKDQLVASGVSLGAALNEVYLYTWKENKWESMASVLDLSNAGFGYNLQGIDDHTLLISTQVPGELQIYHIEKGGMSDTRQRVQNPDMNQYPGFGDLTAYSNGMLYVAVRGSTEQGDRYPGKIYVFKHIQ